MKPIVERMLAVPSIEMIRESVLQPEPFYVWLSNICEKHKSTITKFHASLLRLLKNDETVSCYSESIQLFCEALKQYLAISKNEDHWWKNVYTILNENNMLKSNPLIAEMLEYLKTMMQDIVIPEEYAPTEPGTPVASASSQSSQEVPPTEEDVFYSQARKRRLLLRTFSGTEVRRNEYARQGSMPEFNWRQRYSIYDEGRKHGNALTNDVSNLTSASKRVFMEN